MAVSHTTEPLAASVAGALLLAAMSSATASAEEVVAEPDVTRRPDTSSFHFASTFQVRGSHFHIKRDTMYFVVLVHGGSRVRYAVYRVHGR